MLKICGQIGCQEYAQKSLKRAETQNIENQIIREHITITSVLTQEKGENIKLILKNHDCKEGYIT